MQEATMFIGYADTAPVALGLDPASLISLAIGTVLPLLVGLVTKRATNANAKAVLLLALTAVSGFLSTLLAAVQGHTPFNWVTALVTTLVTFVVAVAAHYGLWKPTGAAGAAQGVGDSAPTGDHVPGGTGALALALGDQPAPDEEPPPQ